MVYENLNEQKFKQDVMKKLISFCDKCPVLLSIRTGKQDDKEGVFIIHKNTGKEYFFAWDLFGDPKAFIHDIKETIKVHYPILCEQHYEDVTLTPEELAKQVEEGTSIDSLKKVVNKVVSKTYWQIDKVLLWKDIVIMKQIPGFKGEEVNKDQFRFKYNGSLVVFLKKYREGEFKTVEEAGDEFFKNSIMVNEILPKETTN